jgi:hypothetical protein
MFRGNVLPCKCRENVAEYPSIYDYKAMLVGYNFVVALYIGYELITSILKYNN